MRNTVDYFTVIDNVVSTTTIPTPLQNSPIDWDATRIEWARHKTFHGVFRSFMESLAFVRQGATINRHVYLTEGVNGRCVLVIKVLNDDTQLYDGLYIGDIDYSQASNSPFKFNVAVKEQGLVGIIKNKDRTPYDIPLLDIDCKRVFMDGTLMKGNAHYIVPKQGQATPIRTSFAFGVVPSPNGDEGLNDSITAASSVSPVSRLIYQTTAPEQNTITVKNLTVSVFWPSSAAAAARFALRVTYTPVSSGTTVDFWQAPVMQNPGTSRSYLVNGTYSFPLPANGQVEIEQVMLDSSGNMAPIEFTSTFQVLDDKGTIDISSEYVRPSSVVRSLSYQQACEKLVALIAPGYTFASSYLSNQSLRHVDSKPSFTFLTSGNGMRGLGDGLTADSSAKLTLTLEDIRKDSYCRNLTGIGITGNTVRLEQLSHFYDNTTVIADLGFVKDLGYDPMEDFFFNLFKFGYTSQETDKLNGKDDPLLTSTFSAEHIVKAEADFVSPFIASYINQEFLRSDRGTKPTTDMKSDKGVCLIGVNDLPNGNGEYTLRRDQNLSTNILTGLFAGSTAYNLEYLIGRNIKRLSPILSVALHLLQNGKLKFQTTDQNAAVISQLSGLVGSITENADVSSNDFDLPPFLPVMFNFLTKVPLDIPTLLASNPYGRVNFKWRHPYTGEAISFGGFIDKVSINPANRAAQQWNLIAAPDTDLSKLTH